MAFLGSVSFSQLLKSSVFLGDSQIAASQKLPQVDTTVLFPLFMDEDTEAQRNEEVMKPDLHDFCCCSPELPKPMHPMLLA